MPTMTFFFVVLKINQDGLMNSKIKTKNNFISRKTNLQFKNKNQNFLIQIKKYCFISTRNFILIIKFGRI